MLGENEVGALDQIWPHDDGHEQVERGLPVRGPGGQRGGCGVHLLHPETPLRGLAAGNILRSQCAGSGQSAIGSERSSKSQTFIIYLSGWLR